MSGTGARTRVKMRERAINVKSRLFLCETPDLGADEDDDETQDEGGNNNASSIASTTPSHMSIESALHPLEEGDDGYADGSQVHLSVNNNNITEHAPNPGKKQKTRLSLSTMSQQEEEKEKKKPKVEMSMIPTPPIFEDIEYDKQNFLPWRPPESLIKFVANTGSELNTAFDFYELRQDDISWLKSYNEVSKPSRPVLPEQMESLLDMFEKETSYRSKLIDPVGDFPCSLAKTKARDQLQLAGPFVEHIYEYWRARRKMLRKALMRKFQSPPLEPGPHVAFVPRIPSRRASSRNPRKNDLASFRKMTHLKEDFLRVLDIISRLKKRELIKRHMLQVQTEEFDVSLEKTPWATHLNAEREVVLKQKREEQEALEEKKRQKAAERAGRPPLPVDEHPEFPGYFLGPFFSFPEAYNVELQTCNPRRSERENCAWLLTSNIPRSTYVGTGESEGDGTPHDADKKETRPVFKRARTGRGKLSNAHNNNLANGAGNHSMGGNGSINSTGTSNSNTVVLPRSMPRLKRTVDMQNVVANEAHHTAAASVDSSSESDDWDDGLSEDDEYLQRLEAYLKQHGRDPNVLSPFLARAFDEICIGNSVPPLENPQKSEFGVGPFSLMDESTDNIPLSILHANLQANAAQHSTGGSSALIQHVNSTPTNDNSNIKNNSSNVNSGQTSLSLHSFQWTPPPVDLASSSDSSLSSSASSSLSLSSAASSSSTFVSYLSPCSSLCSSACSGNHEELHKLTQLDNYSGYCRGRMSRCGRALFDIYWKEGQAEIEPISESESEVEDINLDSIDDALTLHNGVIFKKQPPLFMIHGLGPHILPE